MGEIIKAIKRVLKSPGFIILTGGMLLTAIVAPLSFIFSLLWLIVWFSGCIAATLFVEYLES